MLKREAARHALLHIKFSPRMVQCGPRSYGATRSSLPYHWNDFTLAFEATLAYGSTMPCKDSFALVFSDLLPVATELGIR